MKFIHTSFLVMGLLLSAVSFTGFVAMAKQEYTKKEKKPCTACHVKAGQKDLNTVGKCYEEKKDLKSCTAKK